MEGVRSCVSQERGGVARRHLPFSFGLAARARRAEPVGRFPVGVGARRTGRGVRTVSFMWDRCMGLGASTWDIGWVGGVSSVGGF
jgi:hypothetical protein